MKLEPYILQDFTNGVIDDKSVSDYLLPRNAVRKAINCVFDTPRGSISQRYGTTAIGSTVSSGNTITGIHNFRSSNTSLHKLLGVATTIIYYWDGSNWTSTVTGLTAGKMRFLTYLNSVVYLNGEDQSKSWTGSGTWTSSGGNLDVGNFPKSKFGTILNTRIFCAGDPDNPDTVNASSLESSGTISWTSGNKSFKVFTNDGNGSITSLIGNGKVILIFKDRGFYRYDDNQLDRIVNIGTPSHESVVNDDNGLTYFFGQGANSVGFFMSNGGRPIKISRPIPKWVEAIDPAFYGNVSAWINGSEAGWSVGSVTIDGITYSNACYVYSISDKTWSIRNYDDSFRVFSSYITSTGALTIVGGDTDGYIQTIDSGTTDNGIPIYSECEFGSTFFTSRGRTKVLNEFVAYATHFQGLTALVKVDNKNYDKIGDIKNTETIFKTKLRGKRFDLKISATNSGTPWQFDGFEFYDVDDENYGL